MFSAFGAAVQLPQRPIVTRCNLATAAVGKVRKAQPRKSTWQWPSHRTDPLGLNSPRSTFNSRQPTFAPWLFTVQSANLR